jgi:hypothetical protein
MVLDWLARLIGPGQRALTTAIVTRTAQLDRRAFADLDQYVVYEALGISGGLLLGTINCSSIG